MNIYFTPVTFLMLAMTICSCRNVSTDQKAVGTDPPDTIDTTTAPHSDTVNNPRLVLPANDGSLHLTAENGRGVGPEIKYMPEWRAFGWFTAADRVEWEVDVQASGEHEVHLQWSVSDEEAGKEFLLVAGDQQLAGTVEKTGSWETFKTKNIGRIKLAQGRQKIVFKPKTRFKGEALLDLRDIKLVKI